jgi:c(7)-type cytochrome triheme protein
MIDGCTFSCRAGLLVGAALLAGGALAAQVLPKLPDGLPLPQSADSPAQVTFNHVTHVDEAKPACTTCHPSLFRILPKGSPRPKATITHAAMEKGELCGACHDGKKAFALADDCTLCHTGQ